MPSFGAWIYQCIIGKKCCSELFRQPWDLAPDWRIGGGLGAPLRAVQLQEIHTLWVDLGPYLDGLWAMTSIASSKKEKSDLIFRVHRTLVYLSLLK
jgi:hypothetical protein